ncbi:sugar kinase [Agrobacterium rubi]|uniref:Sugar kinase n=1 Tax=Agrobacterium rubi TaxID=28099 RepID=A0AAE7UQH7_9HYPH|nr:sugar kinase [Agrobacterium rubi]NTE87015.1 sugar kinase [Agrobacterium rubi]NTF02949.1 sugar kinase [Agrobacterium rubi]NTF37193.1 sugar kinase [Agrobacterium rubi]OCJ55233.1 2-dehydro-3-deoxygluconokinase [Agrobacterium rubi]QTF99619.1 sugar kinase [Agrobacterium rubi]
MGGRFLSIGECMVELSQAGDGLLRKGFAGDTLNTAWYARACLPSDWTVDYFTALGDDPLSQEMLDFIDHAGILTSNISRIKGGTPGLYLINLKDGERTFSYWRNTSAARQLAADADHLRGTIEAADVIYFSGITLAILATPLAIDTFLAELRRAKAFGKQVVFDPNIRPRLWTDKNTMLKTITDGARAATVVMPSFDDEAGNFGDASIDATIKRYRDLGVANVVVKDGANGATLDFDGQRSHASAVQAASVVDTTSAGDSFNGAFLAKWVSGSMPQEAAIFAAKAAATVIGHHGALIPHDLLPNG